jgi:hypothetical protein
MLRTLFVALVVLPAVALADDLTVLPAAVDGIAPPQMMHAYLTRRVAEASDRRLAEYETFKTPEALISHQQRLRQFFFDQLGELPERTPLHGKTVGKQDRDGYRIEKILFESQPQHYVTAILYLPNSEPPYPGVLVPCGHSANGKARDLYQRMPILLAKNGMAALCYDPIDQGERHQLLDADGKPLIASSTVGHCLTGVGAILLGRNTATYRIWDGLRAIDYLASRPEVDPKRIGCTGISGGGTMTSYLMALDDRIQAAAPGCYLTTFRRLLETIGPQDAEQNIFAQLAAGMDHADYILMRAPKPTLILTATRDYFDIGGSWDTFRQAKRWYARHGYAERVDLFETDDKHGFPQPMRVASARWMRRWLLGIDDAIEEIESPVAKDEDVWCTPRGETLLLDGARSVYDLNMELEAKQAKAREQFWRTTPPAQALDEVRRICGVRPLKALPQVTPQKVGSVNRDGYRIDKLLFQPEPGIALPALAFVPQKPSGQATLYLHEAGKHADAGPGGPIEKLVREGHLVLAVDLRGIGETQVAEKKTYAVYLGNEWREASVAYLLGTSYLAMRAEDILVCARYLANASDSGKPNAVHLVSIGRVGPPALHAAALEPQQFASVRLKNCLVSWAKVVRTPLAKNQYVNLVHGALKTYDLPDLLRAIPAEKRVVESPLDATELPVAVKE